MTFKTPIAAGAATAQGRQKAQGGRLGCSRTDDGFDTFTMELDVESS